MKHAPDLERVIERMRPGALTLRGFLGTDRRDLAEVLDADAAAAARLGVAHADLARTLQAVLRRAAAALGTKVPVGRHHHAEYLEAMGRVPCPWGDGTFQKGEVTLVDDRTGEALRFSPLSIHMIAAHGFYNGRGSRYRLEPAALHRLDD